MELSTPVRVAAYVAGLTAAFGLAVGAGQLVGPVGLADADADPAAHAGGGHEAMAEEHSPGGVLVSEAGYTLVLDDTRLDPGRGVPLDFTITGPDGEPVTDYDVEHEKRLHLIVVRRDTTGFQHVHPVLDTATGTWSTALDLAAGDWRVLADFVPADGADLTLGADLAVPGDYAPAEPTAESRQGAVDDYTVALDGDLVAGASSTLTLSVERDGVPVSDLQPYLGAYGHLVALREGDLAYLHVHPEESATAGPQIRFVAEVPSAGRYRLFLDFRHDGRVRTAEFTVTAGGDR